MEARRVYTSANELSNITLFYPDAPNAYEHSEGLPIVTGVIHACSSRHSVTLECTGNEASMYTATESAGVFTDNLD